MNGDYFLRNIQNKASAGSPRDFNVDMLANKSGDTNLPQIIRDYLSLSKFNMSITVMDSAAFTFYELTNLQDNALDIARNSIFVTYVRAI